MNDTYRTPNPDTLGNLWDALVSGQSATGPEANQLRSIHDRAVSPRFNPSRKQELKGELMEMIGSAQAQDIRSPSARSASSFVPAVAMTGIGRWLAIAATIALLAGTALVGYFGLVHTSNPEPTQSTGAILASPAATDEPAPIATIAPDQTESTDNCVDTPQYVPCRRDAIVGEGQVVPQILHQTLRNGREVSLFRWTVPPGESDSTSFDTSDHNGFAVDFVERGAYRATFSEPVVVYRGDTSVIPVYQTFYDLLPGEVVELSRGDTVIYPLGSRTSVENPFATMDSDLYGATLVVSELADVSVPINSSVTTLGANQLPKSINDYLAEPSKTGVAISLMWVQVPAAADLSSRTNGGVLALGPLYSEPGLPELAYVVWLVFAAG